MLSPHKVTLCAILLFVKIEPPLAVNVILDKALFIVKVELSCKEKSLYTIKLLFSIFKISSFPWLIIVVFSALILKTLFPVPKFRLLLLAFKLISLFPFPIVISADISEITVLLPFPAIRLNESPLLICIVLSPEPKLALIFPTPLKIILLFCSSKDSRL